MWSYRAVYAGLLLLVSACSMTRPAELWTNKALEIRQLEDQGRLDEASQAYARLLEDPPNADKRRWVEYRQAEILREKGDLEGALVAYQAIWQAPRIDEWGAKAKLSSAEVLEQQGDSHAALSARLQTILKYPNEIGAEYALQQIYDRFVSTPKALDGLLEDLAPHLEETYLAGNVLYLKAQNLDQNLGDIDAAAMTYRRIYTDFPEDALSDDALWEMTNIYRRVQAWPQAIQNLIVLATNVETSWFVGSYASQWVPSATFDLGVIHLLYLSQYDTAVYWFERFADTYEDSLRAPEALFYAAEARRLQHQEDRHFAILKRIAHDYPDSKWARRANDRLGKTVEP